MAEQNEKIDGLEFETKLIHLYLNDLIRMTAITFILFAIANNEDVQQKLYKEMVAHDCEQNYKNSIYMDAVIKEAPRLHPPVPFIGRILKEDTFIV